MVTYSEAWEEKLLEEIFDIVAGGDLDNLNYSQQKTKKHCYPIYSNGIEREGLYGYTSKTKFPKNSLTITARGTIGVAFYRNEEFDAIIRLLVLIPKNSTVTDSRFFTYYINNRVVFFKESTGVPQLTAPKIRDLNLPVPPLQEQQAIADILSIFDKHIENLTKLIEKKRAIRDGALEDLVTGKVRLDGFQSSWKQIQFSDVIVPKARIGWQGLKKDEYLPQGYSYLIGGTDFEKGKISLENISYVSKQRYEMDVNIQVSAGDVLVTKDGTIGKVAVVPEINKPATLSSGVFVFRVKRGLESSYLYWVLMSSLFSKFIEELSAGSTIKHLYQKDLKKFEFEMPSDVEEQQAIASILTAMDDELIKLEHEKEKIQQIKEGAMDDLLTGKIRLV